MFSYHTGNKKQKKTKREQDLSLEYALTPSQCLKDKFDSTYSNKPTGGDVTQPRPP